MGIDVVLLAGYQQGPFYYFVEDGKRTRYGVEEASEFLGLSPGLTAELQAWDDDYQATLDMSYPPDSKFPTPEAYSAWVEAGKGLSFRIKQESSLVTSVDYQANGSIADGTCVF